ncbi:MAG: hypothetical protein HKN10_17950 [Myxococcales bacterium]|nr:hypothetical protein [Myxococcales bacterium]
MLLIDDIVTPVPMATPRIATSVVEELQLALDLELSVLAVGERTIVVHGELDVAAALIVDTNALPGSRPWRRNIQYREIRLSA